MLTCFAAAAFTCGAMYAILHRAGANLTTPWNYLGDANIFLTGAKTIIEGHWVWRNPRIGMPFGATWLDFPISSTLDNSVMWMLSRFTSSPPLVVNLAWMIGVSLTAASSVYALVRLGFRLATAACFGVLFALLPYTWMGEKHMHCLSCAVPLVAAAAIQLARGNLMRGSTPPAGPWAAIRRIPAYAWAGCALAGVSYVYLAFFACFVLAAAAITALVGRRDFASFSAAAALVGCVGVTTLANLSPTLLYEARNGPNAAMQFKSPAELELYGLRIRYLLTPIPNHPIWPVHSLEDPPNAKFPGGLREHELARLGTVGSIGFLCLIGYAIAALSGRAAGFDSKSSVVGLFGPCATLTFCCILFASVGGLSMFFAIFVTPEIRAWARVFPFIGFFCIVAAAAVAAPLVNRLPRYVRFGALIAVLILGVFDQAVPSVGYDHGDSLYRNDDQFIREIETILPADSAVFELPNDDFPNDLAPGNMLVNDLLRPYIHSRKYRWSWGAVSGTTPAEWSRVVARMPVPAMLKALVHQDFAGLWLDDAGYSQTQSPETAISSELGLQPVSSPDKRFLF
jgi:phosphoglycerol transferase